MLIRAMLCCLVALSLMSPARTDDVPKPNGKGDFTSNDAPVKAKAPTGAYMAGSLWVVVAPGLAGRAEPSLTGKVVTTFKQGTILQADVGRGGSDEVLQNAVDPKGHTWMRVRTEGGKDLNCYVRANVKFIKPVTAK